MKFISKKLQIFLLVLVMISGAIVASGYFYYQELNRAEDPRIVDARKIMAKYNKLMSDNEADLALLLLDKVEEIYSNTAGYEDSYELGVVENNRGSIFLIKAETALINSGKLKNEKLNSKKLNSEKQNNKKTKTKTNDLALAREHITNSINIYVHWLEEVSSMSREEIYDMILPFFRKNDPAFANRDISKIIEKRVNDIIASKLETKRRLSVSYTNLGIINRYEGNFKKAQEQYEKAIELWPENHVAKDNLNRLLGLPVKKRNFIKQIFFKNGKT